MEPEVEVIEASDEIQKRGLTGSRRAKKGHEFILADGEREVIERSNACTAHGVVTRDVVELDGGIGRRHGYGVIP